MKEGIGVMECWSNGVMGIAEAHLPYGTDGLVLVVFPILHFGSRFLVACVSSERHQEDDPNSAERLCGNQKLYDFFHVIDCFQVAHGRDQFLRLIP
jgi:hypothetical protein